jgi:hypothetical protein
LLQNRFYADPVIKQIANAGSPAYCPPAIHFREAPCLSMIFSENRFPLFRIML